MEDIKVWDPIVRTFHWATVFIVFINFFVIDEGSVHEFLGYALVVLLVLRLLWGFMPTGHARFASFFPTSARLRRHVKDIKEGTVVVQAGHNPIGALMIFNLLATLALVCATGHLATTDHFWGTDWVEEIHELFCNWLMISVFFHVGGVLFESFRSGINLIQAMFSGIKRMP